MDISNDIYCIYKYNLNEDLFNKEKFKKYIKNLKNQVSRVIKGKVKINKEKKIFLYTT